MIYHFEVCFALVQIHVYVPNQLTTIRGRVTKPSHRIFVCFTIFRVDNYLRHRTSLIWAGIIFEATVSISKPYNNCLDQFSIRFLKIFFEMFFTLTQRKF